VAFLFNTTTGALVKRLDNPTPASPDGFGAAVAISGNSVLVGAGAADDNGTDSGAAYVFDASSGSVTATLEGFPHDGNEFGFSVALDSYGNMLVGAPNAGSDEGTAELYNQSSIGFPFPDHD